jgi:hypothetical protein
MIMIIIFIIIFLTPIELVAAHEGRTYNLFIGETLWGRKPISP